MLNEGLEFREYNELQYVSPIYNEDFGTCYFGRLSMDYLKNLGLHRPLLILARGYLWHDYENPSLPEIDLASLSQEELNQRVQKVIGLLESYLYLNPEDILPFIQEDWQQAALDRYKKHLEGLWVPSSSGTLMKAFLDALYIDNEKLRSNVISCMISIADLSLTRRNGFGEQISELAHRKPFVNSRDEKLKPVFTKDLFSYSHFSFDSLIAEALWLGPLKNFVAWIPFENIEKIKAKRYLEAAQPKKSVKKARFLSNVYFLAYLKAMQGVYHQSFVPVSWGDLSCYFHSKAIANGISDKNMIRCLEKPENHGILVLKSILAGPQLAGIKEDEDVLSLIEVKPYPVSENHLPSGEGIYLEDNYAKDGGLSAQIAKIAPLIWKE